MSKGAGQPTLVPEQVDTFTQFLGTEHTDTTDIVVGFDLGTSSAKVVLRTPYVGGARCVAVPFLEEAGIARYLLPARVYEDVEGRFSLQRRSNATRHDNPKWNFIRSSDRWGALVLMCAYTALALRHARRWFLETERASYGHFRLQWAMNIGIPSANYNKREMTEDMRQLANAAWSLSCRSKDLRRADVEQALKAAADLDGEIEVGVFPEVVATVAGHAHTHMREEGLQLLVDVGASTLDVCSFLLYARKGEDCYSTLTASVEPLGIQVLHRKRMEAVGAAATPTKTAIDMTDPFARIPDDGSAYATAEEGVRELRRVDRDHREACRRVIFMDLLALKKRRHPRSRRWDKDGAGLPVFLTGGGSDSDFYAKVLSDAEGLFTAAVFAPGFDRRTLPLPRNLHAPGVRPDDFGRLAVAYGLSVPGIDIGHVEPPSRVPDGKPIGRTESGESISKDHV